MHVISSSAIVLGVLGSLTLQLLSTHPPLYSILIKDASKGPMSLALSHRCLKGRLDSACRAPEYPQGNKDKTYGEPIIMLPSFLQVLFLVEALIPGRRASERGGCHSVLAIQDQLTIPMG